MKLAKKLKASIICSILALTCAFNVSNVKANTLSQENKANIIRTVDKLGEMLDMSPEVVMANYVDLSQNLGVVSEEILMERLVKVFNTNGSSDKSKFIMYDMGGKISKNELDEYLDDSNTDNVYLKLKDAYLDLGKTLYEDWSNSSSNKPATIVSKPNFTSDVDFGFVIDRSRLNDVPLRVTSQYAYRDDGEMHRALDFATKEFVGENGKMGELNLYPVEDGTVVQVQRNPNTATGLSVWYQFKDKNTGDLYNIVYMHMSSIPSNINVGSKVSKDSVIGVVGSTGDANGIHIHMQVEKNGERINPLRLWGYDPSSSADERLNWFIDNNLAIQCAGECTQPLNFTGNDTEFSIVKCRLHRNN